ncbi:hypothetical protein N0V82_006916 [Gnomoniopsis sp. IMI 355080]|nr:hypothetical protein N0V82_006916 [Gnomoniopsis sp. IMI 355080]
MTSTDLVMNNALTEKIDPATKRGGILEIKRILEDAIDRAKTRQGDALVILVGGGGIIAGDILAGVGELIRPRYFEVANAIGAAVGKISGSVDAVCVPESTSIEEQLENAKALAIERCITAGGDPQAVDIVEVDMLPISYVTNGATRIMVRVVSDLVESQDIVTMGEYTLCPEIGSVGFETADEALDYDDSRTVDIDSYQPRIEGDLWYLTPTDLDFLQDGSGVLGVGSCGEPYPTYLACMELLKSGVPITIRRQDSIEDADLVLVGGFMLRVTSAIQSLVNATGINTFDAIVPNEIGGLNAFESLLAAARLQKSVLDTDCVGRAYPYLWQTVRCLDGVPVAPVAVADGQGRSKTDTQQLKAWSIGRSIALAREQKRDVAYMLVQEHNGVLLGTGKITSVTRTVGEGFTKGNVVVSPDLVSNTSSESSLLVTFENENLLVTSMTVGDNEKVLAVCPDLITLLDNANGAPLGVSDYKYGVKVSVIALRSPPVWSSEKGLSMGGPAAFG